MYKIPRNIPLADKMQFYILSGHGESDLAPKALLKDFLDGIDRIIKGKETGVPENTFAGPGLRCDWEGTSIVYDPRKLV